MSAFEVFLSSTIEDFGPYRRAIKEALDEAEIACFPSEGWNGGYVDICCLCRDKIQQTEGFLLLLGYWCGYFPSDSDKSITRIEFEEAMKKWNQHPDPPLAVMRPSPLSAADKELKDQAEQLLLKQSKAARKLHASRLANFFKMIVVDSGRLVRTFENQHQLGMRSAIIGMRWTGYTPLAITRGKPLPCLIKNNLLSDITVTIEQLGALGRRSQFTAIQEILTGSAACPDVPAIALLVWGDDDAGQKPFLRRLLKTRKEFRQRKTTIGRPTVDRYDLPALIQWIAQALGMTGGDEITTAAELADRVAVELKAQPLYFVLDQVHRLSGGVMAFWTDFWQPFYDHLQTVRARQHIEHRLIAVVVDYTGNAGAWQTATCQPAMAFAANSYRRLFAIPRLEPFTARDIWRWLREDLELTDDDISLAHVVKDVMHDAQGNLDGIPWRVFDRLQDNPILATLLTEKTHE